jgi:hypothetical protein
LVPGDDALRLDDEKRRLLSRPQVNANRAGPEILADVRALLRTMAQASPRSGSPRIHGELLNLAIHVCETILAK